MAYRTIAKKVFWEFDFIVTQNLSDILPLFCTPTWPSHHVSENQEYLEVFFLWKLVASLSEKSSSGYYLNEKGAVYRDNFSFYLLATDLLRKKFSHCETISSTVAFPCNFPRKCLCRKLLQHQLVTGNMIERSD